MSEAMPTDIIVGVDTHKHTHYAAVIDANGRLLGHQQFPATDPGYARLLAWMLRRNLSATRIELPFSPSPDIETFRTMLDGPLVFDAERAAIVLDRAWLGAPLMRDERDIEELVTTSPRVLLSPPRYELSTGEQVRRLIESGLRIGEIPGAVEIAARLATSQQTLRRRLAEEHSSVRDLIEEVRRDAATAALAHGDESVAELADLAAFVKKQV